MKHPIFLVSFIFLWQLLVSPGFSDISIGTTDRPTNSAERNSAAEEVPRLPLYSPVPKALVDPGPGTRPQPQPAVIVPKAKHTTDPAATKPTATKPTATKPTAPTSKDPTRKAATTKTPTTTVPGVKPSGRHPLDDLARRMTEAAKKPSLNDAMVAMRDGRLPAARKILDALPKQGMSGLLASIEQAYLLERLGEAEAARSAWKQVDTLAQSLRSLGAKALADLHLNPKQDRSPAPASSAAKPPAAQTATPNQPSPVNEASKPRSSVPTSSAPRSPAGRLVTLLLPDAGTNKARADLPAEVRPVAARPPKIPRPVPWVAPRHPVTPPPTASQPALLSAGGDIGSAGDSLKSVPTGAISVAKFRHTRFPGTQEFEERRRMEIHLTRSPAILNLRDISYEVVFFDRDPEFPDEVFLSRTAPVKWDVKVGGKGRDSAVMIRLPYHIPSGARRGQANDRNLAYHGFCLRIYHKDELQQVYARPLNLPMDSLLPADFQMVK